MKVGLLGLAYLCVAGLGWFFAQKKEPSITDQEQGTKSSQALTSQVSGSQLLEQLIPTKKSSNQTTQEAEFTLPSSDDPRKDFRRLYDSLQSSGSGSGSGLSSTDPLLLDKLSFRLREWLHIDPVAALQELNSLDQSADKVSTVHALFFEQLAELLEQNGLRDSLAWLPDAYKLNPTTFSSSFFELLGKTGNLADLQLIKNQYPEWLNNNRSVESMAQHWPFERRAELLQKLEEDFQSQAILKISLSEGGSEGLDWFLSIYRDEATSPLLKTQLGKNNHRVNELIQNSGVSIERRADLAREFGRYRGMSDHAANSQVIYQDLRGFLNNSNTDRLYAFDNGQVSATELYDSLLKELPTMSTQADEARSQLFRSLAEINPEAAAQLYQGAGQEALDWQKLYAARWWFHRANPETFFKMVQSVQLDFNDPKVNSYLTDSWKTKTQTNLSIYGSDYLTWVDQLPEGSNRDLALEAIINSGNPTFAKGAQLLIEKQ
ncbi:MAG: hypothetical protein ACSHYB_12280 [Roseibacillus sp.]